MPGVDIHQLGLVHTLSGDAALDDSIELLDKSLNTDQSYGTSVEAPLAGVLAALFSSDITLSGIPRPLIEAGNWDQVTPAAIPSGMYRFSTGTLGAKMSWERVALLHGSWEAQVYFAGFAQGGKFDLLIDGATVVAGIDSYNASSNLTRVTAITPFTVPATKLVTVSVLQNGTRNASSTGDVIRIAAVGLHRIGN